MIKVKKEKAFFFEEKKKKKELNQQDLLIGDSFGYSNLRDLCRFIIFSCSIGYSHDYDHQSIK